MKTPFAKSGLLFLQIGSFEAIFEVRGQNSSKKMLFPLNLFFYSLSSGFDTEIDLRIALQGPRYMSNTIIG